MAVRSFAFGDDADLVDAERRVRAVLGDHVPDLAALSAVSNIFRVATAVRAHMERTVLGEHELSWSAFVVLFVLRVWGEQETSALAAEAGITGGTLTGVLKTLERRELATRREHEHDRRRVLVTATPDGAAAIDSIMPGFNAHEQLVTRDLSPRQTAHLTGSLRTILQTVATLDGGET